jgi:Anti-sigma-28 factor, FlgM
MTQTREQQQRLGKLKELIERGEYEVDPQAIADAIVDRLRATAALVDEYQKECSNPESSPSASVKTTPAGPSKTRPTQVRRWLSISAAALGGMQTQSS